MSLNLKDVESLDSSVKRAFYLQNISFSTFQASIAEPTQTPPEAPEPLAKTLENYADEGCLICSVHHVGYLSLPRRHVITFAGSVISMENSTTVATMMELKVMRVVVRAKRRPLFTAIIICHIHACALATWKKRTRATKAKMKIMGIKVDIIVLPHAI